MIINSGEFDQPISTVFPKLYSLKVLGRSDYPKTIITNCPQLVQLSLVYHEAGANSHRIIVMTKMLTKILPFYDLTLQNLQLIQNEIKVFFCNRRGWFKELSKEIIGALAFCENLKFLEISGFLYISEQSSRILGRGHSELEAVMLNHVETREREVKVYIRPRDLGITYWLVNQVLISNVGPFEVLSHTWARTCKTS
jgi:hypothetical protein